MLGKALAALAVVTLVTGAAADSGSGKGSDSGKISFWSDRGRPQVYVMNPDGSRQRRLTSLYSAKRADWSPDGARIVFDGRAYRTNFDFDIFVANADGSRVRTVTRGAARDVMASWSPDGRQIAFARTRAGVETPEIWVVRADDTSLRRVTADGDSPAWSPDGRLLAYSNATSVVLVRPDGRDKRVLAPGTGPAWAPDGKRLVYTNAGDVWLMDADGRGRQQLTSAPADDVAADWSPDGRLIVLTSDRTGNKEVFVMRADGSAARNLTRHSADDNASSWQPLR